MRLKSMNAGNRDDRIQREPRVRAQHAQRTAHRAATTHMPTRAIAQPVIGHASYRVRQASTVTHPPPRHARRSRRSSPIG